jgi:hypothetical protein
MLQLPDSWAKVSRSHSMSYENGCKSNLIVHSIVKAIPTCLLPCVLFGQVKVNIQTHRSFVLFITPYSLKLTSCVCECVGVKGIFRGFMITCVKSSVSSAVTFYTYEQARKYLISET